MELVTIELLETIMDLVGRRLRELRKRGGYKSAEAFAEALKMHPNSVYAVERGDSWISPELLERASTLLRVSPSAFFSDTEKPLKPTPEEALEVLREAIKKP